MEVPLESDPGGWWLQGTQGTSQQPQQLPQQWPGDVVVAWEADGVASLVEQLEARNATHFVSQEVVSSGIMV